MQCQKTKWGKKDKNNNESEMMSDGSINNNNTKNVPKNDAWLNSLNGMKERYQQLFEIIQTHYDSDNAINKEIDTLMQQRFQMIKQINEYENKIKIQKNNFEQSKLIYFWNCEILNLLQKVQQKKYEKSQRMTVLQQAMDYKKEQSIKTEEMAQKRQRKKMEIESKLSTIDQKLEKLRDPYYIDNTLDSKKTLYNHSALIRQLLNYLNKFCFVFLFFCLF